MMLNGSLRSAVAGRIYNLCAITHQIQVLTEPLCRAQATFYALPKNEQGTVGYPKARSKTVRESIARGKLVCEFDFHLTVSITVVRSIETPQTTPKLHQTTQNHNGIYSQYHIMRDFLGHSLLLRLAGEEGACAPNPLPLDLALALCKNTYSDRAKRPPAFLKS